MNGLLSARGDVDRSTVWRYLQRRGVDTRRRRRKAPDQRRYEYPNRLQLVLCDGKHFRAGPSLVRRLALFFIDDASRYVPTAIVGTGGESAHLFLRALYRLLRLVGRVDGIYVDHGSGFIANDTSAVLASLEIAHIIGTTAYPQGRGKIERFNLTAQEHLLRHLRGADVDPDPTALELRIEHFLREHYNRWPHESLSKSSPRERFVNDPRALRPYEDEMALRRHFFVPEERVVSNDHVVQLEGKDWEVPRGLAGQKVTVRRDVLEAGRYFLEHNGDWLQLATVRLHDNARAHRRGVSTSTPEPATATQGAALASADEAYAPITQEDGGFMAPPEETDG